MGYTLILGNKNYSSWSMRAWLLLRFVGAPFREVSIDLYTSQSRREVLDLGGQTGLVPVLKDGDTVIWETLAITEYLYESFPSIWPKSSELRAKARSLCGEISSSLSHLRNAMPVNTRARNRAATINEEVHNDIQRVLDIWNECEEAAFGPWLLGDFGAVDIMFSPIATRFQTYGVEVGGPANEFYRRILEHPLVVEWLALGREESSRIEMFELPTSP